MEQSELQRLDNLTPKYKSLLDNLSPQKRKIIVCMARRDEHPLRVKDIAQVARLGQQNRTSAAVCRLKNEGLLTQGSEGKYSITDPDLRKYIRFRSRTDEYSNLAIAN